MAKGETNQGSQIQSSEPWKPAQGKLKDVMGEAKNLYDRDKGFGVYDGAWSVGSSDYTNRALGGMAALAGRGNGLAQNQMDLSSALMGGAYNPDTMGQYQSLYDQAGANAAGAKQNYNSLFNQSGDYAGSARERFNSLYDQAGTDAANANARYSGLSGAYGDVAGQNISDLQGLLGRSNDAAFNSALDTQIGKLGDDITRQFGGSSFGSGAHTGMLGDVLGEARTSATAKHFMDQANLERGLQGDIAGQRTGALGAQAGLAGAMEGADRNSLGARQGLATGAYGIDSNLINTQSGLTGAGYGVDQSLTGARQGLLGGMENANQIGVQNRLAGQGIADQAYQSQYLPYERLAQVGATREGYQAAQLQGEMDKYNAKQMAPWERLNAYSGLVGGASNGYGTTTGTVSTPSNPWGSAAGGAMLGAQALGPLGALGGGLLGYLGG